MDLSNNRLSEIASQLPKLKSVRTLILNFTDATDEVVEQAVEIPGLKSLGLHKTKVTDRSAAQLAGSSLEVLDLSSTQITDGAVSHLSQMEDLRELDLKNTRVTEEAIKRLQEAHSAGHELRRFSYTGTLWEMNASDDVRTARLEADDREWLDSLFGELS